VNTNEGREGSEIVEKKRSRRGVERSKERKSVEYLAISYKVTVTFIIMFKKCKKDDI
jgi:uncharacterized membrane protein